MNVTVPNQETAALFYVNGLGLTRDPYMMTGPANMWVNAGRQQFHLPISKAQVLRGHIGVVVSDYAELPKRLARVGEALTGTRFEFHERDGHIEATCPWGNRIRCFAPDKRFGPMALGVPYVEFDVPVGTAAGIARFYSEIMGAQAAPLEDAQGRFACVTAGAGQNLFFRETDRAASTLRSASHRDLYQRLFGAASEAGRQGSDHPGKRSASVSIPGHRRSR